MTKKRCLSLFMAFCMMLTFLPPPAAFAEDVGVSAATVSDGAEAERATPDAPEADTSEGVVVIPATGAPGEDADSVTPDAPEADTSEGVVVIPATGAPGEDADSVMPDTPDAPEADASEGVIVIPATDAPGEDADSVTPDTPDAPEADASEGVIVIPATGAPGEDADSVTPDAPEADTSEGLIVIPATDAPGEDADSVTSDAPDEDAETVYQVTVPVTFADSDDETAVLSGAEEQPFELPTELPGYVPEARLLAGESVEKTYYSFRGLTYISLKGIPVKYSGSTELGEGLLQVVDSNRKVLLSASYQSYLYSDDYNRYCYHSSQDRETKQYTYTADVNYRWYDTALLEVGKTYDLQLVIGEEIYPCDAVLAPVDGYYLSDASLMNLSPQGESNSAYLSLYGFRTEDDLSKLKLELLDGDGSGANVVATSTGNYRIDSASYYPSAAMNASYIRLYMELKVSDGVELERSHYYYLRVSSTGKPLYTNITMPSNSPHFPSASAIPIEEAKLTQADPAKVRVKLGTVPQEDFDEGYEFLLLASGSYPSGKTIEEMLASEYVYASARFKKGELPSDGVVTLSLHDKRRNSDSVYGLGSFYVHASFVKEDEEATTVSTLKRTSASVRNPYYNSSDNTGSYSFQPEYISTTTTEIPFTITASGWDSVYHTYEDNVVELRKGNDVLATCSDIHISYAQSTSAATLTGTFKVDPLEAGSYCLIYYNGVEIATLQVIDSLRLSFVNTANANACYSYNQFWTQFGEFYVKFQINGGTGSGALVFRKDDADALSGATVQGTKTVTDTWVYAFTFTAEQFKALTAGEKYSLIFRDANGQEAAVFSGRSYNTETVWPTRIRDICYLYQYQYASSSYSGISETKYHTLVGDDVVYAQLYPNNFKNASLETLRDTLKKITFTRDGETLSVKEVGKPFFSENGYFYVALTLSAPLTLKNADGNLYYGDNYYYTVHYASKDEGDTDESKTEDTNQFFVWNSYIPYISTSRGLWNVFQAHYFPLDKTYTGKLYQGTKCLTPTAFPMTLNGEYGYNQTISYAQSVLDNLKLSEGEYTLTVFMDGAILCSEPFSIYYDEIVPSITLYGHHSYTDGVSEEKLETWEGAYYSDSYYYYSSNPRIVIADQTGKYRLLAYNYGDYRYFRFADSLDALASAEFQSVGKDYFEGVLSDKTTRGWRTIYAEFSKKGTAGDSSNYTATGTIYVASNGDWGLTVPEEVGGLHENNKTYTITAALDTPGGILWIGFHDQNGKVAYDHAGFSTFRDGKYVYSYSIYPSDYFYDSNYTGGDNSNRFRYIDTQSIEIFATDGTYVSHSGARYEGNIVSDTVKRELVFGAVDTIYLRNGSNGGNLNTRTYTIAGYAIANDEITVTEGETTVATATANDYGYFTVAVENIADGNHTYSVTGKNTEKGATTSVSVDATPPVINAFTYAFLPDGQNMVLRWYCDDEDIDSFTLYKNDEVLQSSIKPTARSLNIVTEPNNTFSMAAADKYGNQSERVEQVFTDEADPVAVVTPETIQVGKGIETVFEGGMSTDDFGIASYSWDFGDGSAKALTRQAYHTFSELGEYTVTLTVTDYAKKTSTATCAVSVVDAGEPTTFIVHDQNDKAMTGVLLHVTDPDGHTTRYTSNRKGEATLYLPNGLYTVTAVASGYQVRSFSFEITDKRHKFTLYMNTEDILKVETKVEEMTLEQITAAGIDTAAPENQHVYNCVATFDFGKLEYVCNDKEVLKAEPLKAGNITAYVVEKDIFLIVYSRVNWLKEMFKVELLVTNTSDYEVVEDCEAVLTVPDGLSLAKMTADVGAQSESVKLGMVEMGGKASTAWYLAGDKEGTYTLDGTVTGIRVGGGIKEDISIKFKTSDPIQVQAGNAMKLDITAERFAIIGQPYHVNYKLENVSDKDLYNVSLNVLGGKFIEAYSVSELDYDPESGPGLSGSFNDGYALPAETFAPGDTMSGVFTITFGEGLDVANRDGMTYALKDMFVTTGAGSTAVIPTDLHITDNLAFLLSYEGNGSTGSMPGTILPKDPEGEEVEITIPENTFPAPEGQRAAGWELEGQTYHTGERVKVKYSSIKSGVLSLKALWEEATYTVTYDADGGTGELSGPTLKYNETFTLPENSFTPPQYKKFKAWQIGEDEYAPGAEITVTDDTTVKAVWEDITYTVTYDKNGGTGDDMDAATATAGVPFALPENAFTAPEFQRFKAWQIGEDEYAPGAEYTFTADTAVKAVWEDITYTVTYDANGGTEEMEAGTATAGKAFKLPENAFTAPEFKRFKAWQIGRDEYAPGAEYTFTADTTVKAVWEDITYTVTYDANGGTGEMNAATAVINKAFKLPKNTFTAPEFQKFKAWQIGEDEYAPGAEYTFTADTTVKAVWEDITYTVTYNANGATGEMEAGTATAGKAFTLPENGFNVPEFKYFKAWQIGRDEYAPGTEYTFTANTTVSAVWADITYTVTYDANGGTGEMATGTATAGKAFTLPAKADFAAPNFQQLKAWQIGEDEYAPGAQYTFTADTTVTALWEDITYTVTYDANGGSETMEAATATAGKAFTLPECAFTAPEFQRFKAWQIGREEFHPGDKFTFTANTTVRAVWENITYTVTYAPGDGEGTMAPATATAGRAFRLPARADFTAPEFRKLKAWQIGEDEYAPGAEYTFTADTTVTALWEDITYTVTYNASGAEGEMEAATATAGKAFKLPENGFTVPEFKYFKAWQIGREQFQPGEEYTFTANTTVSAVWADITYTLTYEPGEGTGDMDPATATAGKPFTLPTRTTFTAPEFQKLKAWQIGEEEYAPGAEYTFTADTTVKAVWEDITYTVTYNANSGGGAMDTDTATAGKAFTLPENGFLAPELFRFKAWQIGREQFQPGDQFTFTANTTVTAIWENITYTVTYDANGGTGEMDPDTATAGKSFKLPAQSGFTPPEWQRLKAWQIDGEEYEPGATYTFTADTTVKAVWEDITYTVTYDANGGTGEIDAALIKADQTLRLPENTFIPPEFKQFKAWRIGREEYEPEAELTLSADTTVTAVWADITYTVTYDSNGGRGGMTAAVATAGKPFKLPDKVNFVAPTDQQFDGWLIDGEEYAPGDEYTFTADTTVKARWGLKTFTVTFNAGGGSGTMEKATAVIYQPFTLPENGFSGPDLGKFKTWRVNGGEYDPGSKYTFTADTTVTAVWDKITSSSYATFLVKFNTGGGFTPEPQTVEFLSTVSAPRETPYRTGYTFSKWLLNGKEYDFSTPVRSDLVLTAEWTANKYTIRFVDEDGTELSSAEYDYDTAADKIKLPPDPVKAPVGNKTFTFSGWSPEVSDVVGYTVYTATYTEEEIQTVEHTVTFDLGDGSAARTQAVTDGATATAPETPSREGYRFVAWTRNGSPYDFSTPVTADITITAQWEQITDSHDYHTVTFEYGNGDTARTQSVRDGGTVTEPAAPSREGYRFVAWTRNGSPYDFSAPVTSDITITAQWEQITGYHTVTFDLGDGSAARTQSVPDGATVTEPETPSREGYRFVAWTRNGSPYDFSAPVTSDITITAQWEQVTGYHTVTFDLGDGSAARTQSVPDGATVTEPENPSREGYRFVWWTLNGSRYNFSTPVTSDITVTAQWEQLPSYTVTFESNGGSDVESQSVYSGSPVVKPQKPTRDGYDFAAWYRDADLTQLYEFSAPVQGNLTLYAKWTEPGKGCYVATAVYGSYDCPEVWTLRRFRDNVLAKTWYGRLFIRLYYAVSPTAVRLFGDCAWFQNFFRDRLDRMVSGLQADGFASTPYQDLDW